MIVNFPLVGNEDVALIAWTTTPWTLPSNLALCVNPEFLYVKVKGKRYILTQVLIPYTQHNTDYYMQHIQVFVVYDFWAVFRRNQHT